MTTRSDVDGALRAIVVPRLRATGFSGKFPHLRRAAADAVDLISFQFDRHGGAFTIEIAKCQPTGIEHPTIGYIPAAQATAQHRHPNYRKRLGDPSENGSDFWFHFAARDPIEAAEAVSIRLSDPSIRNQVTPDGDEAPYRTRA